MKFLIGILLCYLVCEHGFAKKTKKLPPGLDHLSYAKQGPEDQFTPTFFTWVGNNANRFADVFFEHMSVPKEYRSSVFKSMGLPTSEDTRCNGCITAVELIKLVINLGLEYEDIEVIAIEICEILMAEEGYRGDIICPGVVPAYGPHLVTIFGETTQDGENICTLYGYCVPEAAWIKAENIHYSFFPKQSPKQSNKNSNVFEKLEEMLGISKVKPQKPIASSDANLMIHNAKKRMSQMGVLQKHDRLPHSASRLKNHLEAVHQRTTRQAEDMIKIAFMSDVHVETEYVEGTSTECGLHVCCRGEANGTGSAAPYGDWNCNVPPSTIEMWLQHVATLKPDMVVYTGDTPANSIWAETLDRQHNVTRWLGEKIAEHMPGIPAFTTIGNHETYPTNLYFAPRPQVQELHQVFIDTWGPLAGWGEEQIETFNTAGYYTQLLRPGLRLLAWNSNYGYSDNWYNILNQDQPELEIMQTFVEDTLIAARNNNEKIIALTHHPTGGLDYYEEWETNVMVEYGSVIALHVMGHSHGDGFKIYVDPVTAEARSVELSGPTSNTFSDINPGVRLFYLDATTFDLLDYDQYFFYLGNEDGDIVEEPEIALMYTASEEYEMNNLTAHAFLDLVYRMEDDDVIFDRYYANKRMRVSTGDCSGDCKTNELCGLVATTAETFLACLLHTMGIDTDINVGDAGIYSVYSSVYAAASFTHMPLYSGLLSLVAAFTLRVY